MKMIGKWIDTDIDVVEINGEFYALHGWNGEKYTEAWKCIDRFTAAEDSKKYEVKPVYDWERWNEEDGEFQDAEGCAIDGIIGYEVA